MNVRGVLLSIVIVVSVLLLCACGGGGGGGPSAPSSNWGELTWGSGQWQATP